MAKRVLFLLVVPFAALFAGELNFIKGSVVAHTEVFGDSTINPGTKRVRAALNMDSTIESIKGRVFINASDLVSDEPKRDVHMYEAIGANEYKAISFDVEKVKKNEKNYTISGTLTLHGVSKKIDAVSDIKELNNQIDLNSKFSIKMSDYGIEPPTLLFLTVRDQVDVTVSLKLEGK